MVTYNHTNTCSCIFIEVLFIMLEQYWKQTRCLSNCKQINKWWYIPMVENYSSMKNNGLLIHATIEVNISSIVLCGWRQKAKILLISIWIRFWKRQYYCKNKAQISGWQEPVVGKGFTTSCRKNIVEVMELVFSLLYRTVLITSICQDSLSCISKFTYKCGIC